MKGEGATVKRQLILGEWSTGGESGILGVAVKWLDNGRNTGGEGGFLDLN